MPYQSGQKLVNIWSKRSYICKIYTFYQEKAKDPEDAEESIEGPWIGF